MRLLVVGSINRDIALKLTRAPEDGETVPARELAFYPGGKGANQAVAAARMGAHTALVGCVGSDENGRVLLQSLRDNRVDTRFLQAASRQTGLAVIAVDDTGRNRIIVHDGANGQVTPETVRAALEHPWDALLLQCEIPAETVFAAVEMAAARGIPVILDPAPAAPLAGLPWPKGITALTPNQSEARLLAGQPAETPAQIEKAIRRLAECAEIVIMTLGDRGALVYADGCLTHVPAFPVTAADTTGAGDAFAAAFTVRYVATGDLIASVRYANMAGALAVTKPGAQPSMPTASEVERHLARHSQV